MANQGGRGNNSNRGLTSADKQTREKVSKEGGKPKGNNSRGSSNREQVQMKEDQEKEIKVLVAEDKIDNHGQKCRGLSGIFCCND